MITDPRKSVICYDNFASRSLVLIFSTDIYKCLYELLFPQNILLSDDVSV